MTKPKYHFHVGQTVIIEGQETVLQTKLNSIEGGWVVSPAVKGLRYWNEDEMKFLSSASSRKRNND